MTGVSRLEPGKYVLAVSGGVDSVTLLDLLAHQKQLSLIVAHADHGIREDSHEDALLVAQLAVHYKLPFEGTKLSLGKGASEERARHERYAFLRSVMQKHKAGAIITAHHADDVVETVLINLLRGTGWRGFCSLRSHGEFIRPLLGVYKTEILEYARQKNLSWREDSTNRLPHYLRNYVRLVLLPRLLQKNSLLKTQLHNLWQRQCQLRSEIEPLLNELSQEIQDEIGLRRQPFSKLDTVVADEVLRRFLIAQHTPQTTPQRTRALTFVKTAGNMKKFSLNRENYLQILRDHIIVTPVKS